MTDDGFSETATTPAMRRITRLLDDATVRTLR